MNTVEFLEATIKNENDENVKWARMARVKKNQDVLKSGSCETGVLLKTGRKHYFIQGDKRFLILEEKIETTLSIESCTIFNENKKQFNKIEFDLNELKNHYSICENFTIGEQFRKIEEEVKEVQIEIMNRDITKAKKELLDVITASLNLFKKLELNEEDDKELFSEHIEKLITYKENVYRSKNDRLLQSVGSETN